MKKNNTAEKSILNAEKLTKALKEGTEKTLHNLVNEAIAKMILEDEEKIDDEPETNDEEVVNDDSFEVEDVNVDDDSNVEDETETEKVEDEEDSVEGDDDEWSEFDDFKTGDDEYDFTEEKEGVGEKILKIFNKIEDGDEFIVTRDGDKVEITNTTDDTEEVIELDLDDENDDDTEISTENDVETDNEIEVDEDEDSDEEFEFEFDDEDDELDESINLGYTDDYQKKTAMTTPSNKEVANPEDTYSMDDVPEGDGKRWAGKGNSKPFETKVCCENDEMMMDDAELDDATNVGGAVQQRSSSKSHIPAGRKAYVPKGTRHASFGADYTEVVESIKAENKELKENLNKILGNLKEAAILNVNLGRIVKLLSEETTTKAEKQSILERFSSVKTINEGKTLYNSIKKELNESKKSTVVLEETISVGERKNINETTIFNRSENPSLNLMDRMNNLWK